MKEYFIVGEKLSRQLPLTLIGRISYPPLDESRDEFLVKHGAVYKVSPCAFLFLRYLLIPFTERMSFRALFNSQLGEDDARFSRYSTWGNIDRRVIEGGRRRESAVFH